mgnify:CR=1 FL=1
MDVDGYQYCLVGIKLTMTCTEGKRLRIAVNWFRRYSFNTTPTEEDIRTILMSDEAVIPTPEHAVTEVERPF